MSGTAREGLTIKQSNILEFMEKNAKLRYPTVRVIAKHFGVYPATIHDHIKALRRKGKLHGSSKYGAETGGG